MWNGKVRLAREPGVAGFNVRRRDAGNADYRRLTDALIPSKGGPVLNAAVTASTGYLTTFSPGRKFSITHSSRLDPSLTLNAKRRLSG